MKLLELYNDLKEKISRQHILFLSRIGIYHPDIKNHMDGCYINLSVWDDFHDYEKNSKFLKPYSYFLLVTLPYIFFEMDVLRKFKDIQYWFLYRFSSEHKFHLVDTKLKPGYYDQDTRLFHVVFALLLDYLEENEQSGFGVVPNKRLVQLAEWYKTHTDVFKAELEEIDNKYKNNFNSEWAKEYTEAETRQYELCSKKLIEVIKLRKHLWV